MTKISDKQGGIRGAVTGGGAGDVLVSVVMPVRDGGRYIKEAVESILGQTHTRLELIVVDDGSVDDTVAVVEGLSRVDGRVRLVRRAAQGVVAALNAGFGDARGVMIARMDGDDVALPDRLEMQVAYLQAHPGVGVLGTRAEVLREDEPTGLVIGGPVDAGEVAAYLMRDNCMIHPSVMIRREVFDRLGGYRREFTDAEDVDLWLRASEHWSVANLSQPLLRYRLHMTQVSHQRIEQQVMSRLAAYAVARCRRTKGFEPEMGDGRVDREVLESLGVSGSRVDDAVIDGLASRALLYLKAGMSEPARRLGERIEQMGAAGELNWASRGWRRWALARYRRQEGRMMACVGHLCVAVMMRPGVVAQLFGRRGRQ